MSYNKAQKEIVKQYAEYSQQQKQRNEATEKRYEALDYFEREEIPQMVEKQFNNYSNTCQN